VTLPTAPSELVVGIVGAGAMGTGIAQVAATAGHRTLLLDARDGAAADAVAQLAARLAALVQAGRTTAEQADTVLARLEPVAEVADLSGCGLVVEAVVEDLAVKRELLRALEAVVGPTALLASNTSSLSVTDLASGLERPGRVAGWHFFNPAPRMPLVEVVRGACTHPTVVQTLTALARAWGKVPVSCTSTPGFVVNRVMRPYYGEALRLLVGTYAAAAGPHGYEEADPLTAATVDALLREAGGFPMGPLELTDLIGHDVNAAVNRSLWEATDRDPRYEPSTVQDGLVAVGRLGRKRGQGVYDHTGGPTAAAERQPATVPAVEGLPGRTPRLRAGAGLDVLLERAGLRGTDRTDTDGAATDVADSDGTGTDGAGEVVVALTDGRTAAQVEAATGRPTVLVDLARDQATCTRVGAVASPGCPPGTLTAFATALHPAGVALSPLPDVPGLVVARTAATVVAAAEDAVEAGVATAPDVDLALEQGAGQPQGPLAWGGRLGHRWVVGVLDALAVAEPTGRYRVCPTLRARAMLERDRVSTRAGIELVSAGPGSGVVRVTVTEDMLNGLDIVHGGMVCVVVDTALAVACNGEGVLTVGSGLDVVWLAPGRLGDVLTATATERSRYGGGRRNGLYDITLVRDDGTVVAEVRGRTRVVGPVPSQSAPTSGRGQS